MALRLSFFPNRLLTRFFSSAENVEPVKMSVGKVSRPFPYREKLEAGKDYYWCSVYYFGIGFKNFSADCPRSNHIVTDLIKELE